MTLNDIRDELYTYNYYLYIHLHSCDLNVAFTSFSIFQKVGVTKLSFAFGGICRLGLEKTGQTFIVLHSLLSPPRHCVMLTCLSAVQETRAPFLPLGLYHSPNVCLAQSRVFLIL